MKNTRRIISMVLTVIMMLLPLSSLGATGHIDGCTNTDFSTNCCTKTFIIIPKTGYRVLDVIVNGESKGAITSYTFTNITGPQNLKVITEPIGGTGEDVGGGGTTGQTFILTYNANGGTGTMAQQAFTAGEYKNLIANTFTRPYYNFLGWSSEEGGEVEYVDQAMYTTTENSTLYAIWEQGTEVAAIENLAVGKYVKYVPNKTSHSVLEEDSGYPAQSFNPSLTTTWKIFKNNNGQLDIISSESVGNLTLGGSTGYFRLVNTLNKLCEGYVNPEYAISGRSIGCTSSSIDIVEYVDKPTNTEPYKDSYYTADAGIIQSNSALRASTSVWLASRVVGSFNYAGGLVIQADGTVNTAHNDIFSQFLHMGALSTASDASATFGVRPIISLMSDLWVADGTGTSSDPYVLAPKPRYKVTYKSNGGVGTMATQTFSQGETKNLTVNTFTNLGKNFLGWATSSGGSVQFTDGQSYTATGNLTLYAVWAGQCTIKFNANGGSGTMADQIFSEGVSQALPTNTFTRTAYYFAGWATTAGGTAEYTDGDSYTATGDKTLYAVWEAACLITVEIKPPTMKADTKDLAAGQHYVKPGTSITVGFNPPDTAGSHKIYVDDSLMASGEGWGDTTSYTFVATRNYHITYSEGENAYTTDYIYVTSK